MLARQQGPVGHVHLVGHVVLHGEEEHHHVGGGASALEDVLADVELVSACDEVVHLAGDARQNAVVAALDLHVVFALPPLLVDVVLDKGGEGTGKDIVVVALAFSAFHGEIFVDKLADSGPFAERDNARFWGRFD